MRSTHTRRPDRIINGFIQSVVGLYDYTSITKDPLGLKLFEAGDAEARAEPPRYDTGAWSLYDQYGESDLSYHELLTEFLQHLCERTRKGPPIAGRPRRRRLDHDRPPPHRRPPRRSTSGGGTSPRPLRARPPPATTRSRATTIYCATAKRFTADLRRRRRRSRCSPHNLRGGTRAGVQVSLSKISTVTIKVLQGRELVWSNSATVRRGQAAAALGDAQGGGTFTVNVAARRPRGQLLDDQRDGRRQPSLARCRPLGVSRLDLATMGSRERRPPPRPVRR